MVVRARATADIPIHNMAQVELSSAHICPDRPCVEVRLEVLELMRLSDAELLDVKQAPKPNANAAAQPSIDIGGLEGVRKVDGVTLVEASEDLDERTGPERRLIARSVASVMGKSPAPNALPVPAAAATTAAPAAAAAAAADNVLVSDPEPQRLGATDAAAAPAAAVPAAAATFNAAAAATTAAAATAPATAAAAADQTMHMTVTAEVGRCMLHLGCAS